MSRSTNTGDRIDGVDYVSGPIDRSHMQAFDVLPPEVRRAISEARYDFDPRAVVKAMRNGTGAPAIVRMIRQQDDEVASLAYQQRAKGR